MAITPQAIKDQEFQSKFRGFDTIEVKSYLELVAEEFFELLEKIRQKDEELAELAREKELFQELNEKVQADAEDALEKLEEVRLEAAGREEREQELLKEMEELQLAQADFEAERQEYEEELSAAQGRVAELEERLDKRETELDHLRSRIDLLEEQNRELKDEEVDLKKTIGAAQKFADSLRQNAEEEAGRLERDSQAKAAAQLQQAREEIEMLRREAFAELTRLPDEIRSLRQQRNRVRGELRDLLAGYLERIERLGEIEEEVPEYDYDDLFQKIDLDDFPAAAASPPASPETFEAAEPDDEVVPGPAPEPAVEAASEEEEDELDRIDMDLSLPEGMSLDPEPEHEDERDELRHKLEEGGVAYLSDS